MGPEVGAVIPPDDTGAETFRRYAYQAHVAFPYCLACLLGDDIIAVAAEHLEDLMIEGKEVLRFLQVKTRDPERGPWTFADLCKSGGALHSLLRTHRALKDVADDRQIRYEVLLEGAGRRKDFEGLSAGESRPTEEHVRRCREGLEIEEDEARELLARVTVRDGQPLRSVIEARNVDALIRAAGHLPGDRVRQAVAETVDLVKTAMSAEIAPVDWFTGIIAPDTLDKQAAEVFARKRLTRDHLRAALSILEGGDAALLKTLSDESFLTATALERKLIVAKASEEIVRMAKEYRARAAIELATFRASTLFDTGEIVDDLDKRLLDLATTVIHEVGGSADAMWGRLHERTHQNPSSFDRRKALHEDPVLLMGQICDLSDRCLFHWRTDV